MAKNFRLTIKHRSDTFAYDQYIIDVYPTVFAIWVAAEKHKVWDANIMIVNMLLLIRNNTIVPSYTFGTH